MLSELDKCQEYGITCAGSKSEKKACPHWSVAFSAEEYYEQKFYFEKEFELDKYYKRI